EHSIWEQRVARARIDIDMSRLLCLKAADLMDKAGNKAAQAEIAMIKVYAPQMALQIIDDAVQAHGGAGVSQDFGLAASWAGIRRAIAEALADHGARVVISSRKAEACQEVADAINARHPDAAIVVPASISSKDALQNLVDETKRQLGRIDVLVCNAASNPYYG